MSDAAPSGFAAAFQLGVTAITSGRYEEALLHFDRALSIQPRHFETLTGRAYALLELKRHAEALGAYEQALTIRPNDFAAWNNRGATLMEMQRHPEAVRSFDRALALAPASAGTWKTRGEALIALGQNGEALTSFDKALALAPDSAEFMSHRAWVLRELGRFDEALAAYRALLRVDPDYPEAQGFLVQCTLQMCEWRGLAGERKKIGTMLEAGKRAASPFVNLMIADSPARQLVCSRLHGKAEFPSQETPGPKPRYGHDKIRIAYVSGDFNLHPVSLLMAGIFEAHDKTRFDIAAISFGPDDASAVRARIAKSVDRFVDVRGSSDAEIARLMRTMEIDIAVDLMGFTGKCRTGIFARRPAPVQVNYLGFAATMGMDYFDYILADRVAVPEESRRHYSERVAYLPSFLPNDAKRAIAPAPSRAQCGLPETGFVFASFNNSYKFLPEIFATWMRLLKAVEGSVLWLPQLNSFAKNNLRREAAAQSIAPERLIFAPFLERQEEHLARLGHADLFLDTLPYNAHVTACDALWAGVPVVTQLGTTFAGRVAASALHAIGLPELVACDAAAYEALALGFARDPQHLAAIKAKLAAGRGTQPLFDTARMARSLEEAFARMWERNERGLAPADLDATRN